jgi:hypothetical protein
MPLDFIKCPINLKMSSTLVAPTLLVNFLTFSGKRMPVESHDVAASLAQASKDARDFEGEFVYTLSDIGVMGLFRTLLRRFQERRGGAGFTG